MDYTLLSIIVTICMANLGVGVRVLWLLADYGARITSLERAVFGGKKKDESKNQIQFS